MLNKNAIPITFQRFSHVQPKTLEKKTWTEGPTLENAWWLILNNILGNSASVVCYADYEPAAEHLHGILYYLSILSFAHLKILRRYLCCNLG